jgi:hypothetical protein
MNRKKFFLFLLISLLFLSPIGASYGKDKDQDATSKTKHKSSSKKKKGKTKSKDKGVMIKVENDKQTGPMEDVSNQTEVSEQPGVANSGKSKKSKN